MAGVNKVILVGNLGKDPEVRHIDGGNVVANFSIATTEGYRDKNGERRERTEWHNVVLWRGLAGVAEKYLKKGSQVYIEGRLQTRSWEDKDGNTRYTTEVIGNNLVMLGRASNDGSSTNNPTSNNSSPFKEEPGSNDPDLSGSKDFTEFSEDAKDDDLPF